MRIDFQILADSSPDGVLVISHSGTIVYLNAEAERILEYSRQELLGQSVEILVPERFRGLHANLREFYIGNPSNRPMGRSSGILARRRDGSELPVDVWLSPMGDHNVIATFRDITDRLRGEQELRQVAHELGKTIAECDLKTNLLHAVMDSVGDGVIVLDESGRLQLMNAAAARIFPGLDIEGDMRPWPGSAQASGIFMPDKVTPCPTDELLLSQVRNGEKVDGLEVFVRPSAAAGGIWASMNARPVTDTQGKVAGAVIAVRDTVASKSTHEALMECQEEERKRIARELHDSASQRLCVILLEMEQFERELPPAARELQFRIASVTRQLMEVAEEISSVTHSLHSTVLESLGLAEAMERLSADFSGKGLAVQLSQWNLPKSVSAASALCVYRVAQEGLRNIWRHAKAKQSEVALYSDRAGLNLSIEDNGVGFDLEKAAGKGGLGLVSIRERVRLAGGSLSITSHPGQGTRIRLSIPVNPGPENSPPD